MTPIEILYKYPWFEGVLSYSMEYDDIFFDEAPTGWNYIILMIAQDIDPIIKKNNLDYHILQIKEKFGALRWYDNGGNEEIRRIIDSYEVATKHVCAVCGKPDVGYTTENYIYPVCENCYTKKLRWVTDYSKATCGETLLPERWEFMKYDGKEHIKVEINNTELNNRIRDEWRKVSEEK